MPKLYINQLHNRCANLDLAFWLIISNESAVELLMQLRETHFVWKMYTSRAFTRSAII